MSKMTLRSLLVLLIVITWDIGAQGCEEDLITSLPGMPADVPDNLIQYSGYLQALGERRLHYWLVLSESSSSDIPLVLWLNGGPGCSSLAGLFEEHGPFIVNEDAATLRMREYRWNKVAHMLYLESPAGTGFSYTTDGNYYCNNTEARDNNYAALKSFYVKFPGFLDNDLYIMGQSYGGIYAPMLSALVVQDEGIRFKGFAVGNGFMDDYADINSLHYYAYYHGIMDDQSWEGLNSECCAHKKYDHCDFRRKCPSRVWSIFQTVWRTHYNPYNLNAPCEFSRNPNALDASEQNVLLPSYKRRANDFSYPCMNNSLVLYYLNKASVQRAIHIPDNLAQYGINEWRMCRGAREYEQTQGASVRDDLLHVLAKGHKFLAYYGEADMACNFLGAKWLIDSLGQPESPEPFNRWHYQDDKGITQIAGNVYNYENITFVTVKGAGHMVPVDKPALSFQLLLHLINGTALD